MRARTDTRRECLEVQTVDYDLPKELIVDGNGPVRTVTLNRPHHLNAVNEPLHDALSDVWRQLRADADTRVVILTGAGRAFSAGGDVDFLRRTSEDSAARYETMSAARRIVTEMIAFPLPVLAAVNGPAVGLGCSLALLCDVVLMSEHTYFADPHVAIGLVAADGGVLTWPLLTSLLRAKEYLFTGDRITASEAERFGLANRVVDGDKLLASAHELAERLASQPQQALRDTKRALNIHLSRAVSSVLDFATAAEAETFVLPEFRAFLDSYASK